MVDLPIFLNCLISTPRIIRTKFNKAVSDFTMQKGLYIKLPNSEESTEKNRLEFSGDHCVRLNFCFSTTQETGTWESPQELKPRAEKPEHWGAERSYSYWALKLWCQVPHPFVLITSRSASLLQKWMQEGFHGQAESRMWLPRPSSHQTRSTLQHEHTNCMEHTAVNRSVHTARKQYPRVCMQICMQMCLRILCERAPRPGESKKSSGVGDQNPNVEFAKEIGSQVDVVWQEKWEQQ